VLLGAVAAIALVTGVMVTGLPDSVPSDVVRSDISPPRTTTTLPPTTARTTTTSATSTSTTTAPAKSPPPSTAAPRTAPPTTAPQRTARPRTTTRLTPAASVRVVIANAGEADDLAARTVPVVRRLGYGNVITSTATTRQRTTGLWFRRGMGEEARALAGELGIAARLVRPRPTGRITDGRERGDVWLLIGHDRPRLIEAAMG
jgi:hypothetical protein